MTPLNNAIPDKRGLVRTSRVNLLHQTRINTFLHHKQNSGKAEKIEKQDYSETRPSVSHKPIDLRPKSSKKSVPQSSITNFLHPKTFTKAFSPHQPYNTPSNNGNSKSVNYT
jgi:hypothetical protein